MTLNDIEEHIILRGEVGSKATGLSLEGNSDRDEMAVCVEPIKEALGLAAPFEQLVYRSAAEREGFHDAPSLPGDLDLTVYSLRKYLRLALKGNPTVLTLLYVKPTSTISLGAVLQELAPKIVSKRAGSAFLGYLTAQKQRLLGERGNGGHGKPRSELTEKYGFDTKFAMHMLRLGLQGVELLTTGKLCLPIESPNVDYLLAVRQGQVSLNDCLTRTGELEADIKDLMTTSWLQDEPDAAPVEDWMLKVYFRTWSADRKLSDLIEDSKFLLEQRERLKEKFDPTAFIESLKGM